MKHLGLCCVLLFGITVGSVGAGEVREFILNDGSVLTGELISLKNGVYTLQSQSLGTITIEAAKMQGIRLHPTTETTPAPAPAGQNAMNAQVQQLQRSMLDNPEIVQMLSSLTAHPDFQKILSDPELVRAVQSYDLEALLSNPKFLQLLDNPAVRDIMKQTSP